MTPLYAGVGGVVRELTEMDAGINGVVTPLTEMWAGVDGVNRQIFSAGTPAGNLAIGDIVQLNEDGVAQDYLVVHQGLPSSLYDVSCDGTWLLRKDIIVLRFWNPKNKTNYASSDINTWLNSTMFGMYDPNIQSSIKQVKIPYCLGNGDGTIMSAENGINCNVFLLGGYEVGWTIADNIAFPVDGAVLSYFKNSNKSKRIAYYNGVAKDWWIRSPKYNTDTNVYYVYSSGNYSYSLPIYPYGIRPCIILPQDFVL